MQPRLSAIWAQTSDGIIGDGTGMPWHIPADLKFFQSQTSGHDVIMGRKTWESFAPKYRPLPNRRNLVISSQPAGDWSAGAEVFDSLEAAIAASSEPAWIIGGGQIYHQSIELVDQVVITLINVELAGQLGEQETLAPQLNDAFQLVKETEWQEVPAKISSSIVRTIDTVEIKRQYFQRTAGTA